MKIRTILVIGGWSILVLAFGQLQSQKRLSRNFKLPTTDEKIAQINSGLQTALEDLSQTKNRTVIRKDKDGHIETVKIPPNFGLSRVPTILVDHNGILRNTGVSAFPQPKGIELQYFAASCRGKTIKAGQLSLHKGIGYYVPPMPERLTKEILKFAEKSISSLRNTSPFRGQILDMDAVALPLKVTKPECLPCHAGSKIGDPLAVIVYTIKRTKA